MVSIFSFPKLHCTFLPSTDDCSFCNSFFKMKLSSKEKILFTLYCYYYTDIMKVEIRTFDIDSRDEARAYILKPFDLPLHNPIYDKLKLIIFHRKHEKC